MNLFRSPDVDALIALALSEDVGRGDLTTTLTVPESTRASADIIAKQEGVLAGAPVVARVFERMGADAEIRCLLAEGSRFGAGDALVHVSGRARDVLTGERVALNLLQRLCGVATLTRRFVDVAAGTGVRVVDTRKTTPGARALEKYAVRMGGGHNHRGGLDDGILIKDNHIAAAGGLTPCVQRARDGAPHSIKIEVECTTSEQVEEALRAGADVVLLDNMSLGDMKAAVALVAGRATVEASGGVTLDTLRSVAETGVDIISVGALTHSAPAVDLSLELRLASP